VILTTAGERRALLDRVRTIAMVGASSNVTRPSYFVFSYLRTRGRFAVTPVNPAIGEIDGVRNDCAIVDPYGDSPYILVVLTRELRNTAAGDRGIAAIARTVDGALRPS